MYQNIKSCVKLGKDCSDFFNCDIGVRQGENLSPYLFSIFLNDLEEYFIENNIDSLEKISSICQESLLVYIKLFLILYVDDTVLMSETPEGLQKTLTAFENYCNNWKLKVHTCKTKVVVLCKRRFRSNFIFLNLWSTYRSARFLLISWCYF